MTTAYEAYIEGRQARKQNPTGSLPDIIPYCTELEIAWIDGWFDEVEGWLYGINPNTTNREKVVWEGKGGRCKFCGGLSSLKDGPDGMFRCWVSPRCRETNYPPIDKTKISEYTGKLNAGAYI